ILENPESLMQKVAICSLEKIGDPEAISGLVKATESPDACVRRAALKALERINKSNPAPVSAPDETENPDVEPVLRNCLTGDNSEVHIEASNLSGNIHSMNSLKELELLISTEETKESRAHQNASPGGKKGIGLTCPYCSRTLNLSTAPNFCPFCGMKLELKC
ncbi:MAG TPA: HEAT repeat domain-containing protein, partial [Methanosarcina sp.]|nr:HEAT repeat domain-containing protein [Methanosarcina sp.]